MDFGHREPFKGFKKASKAGNGLGTKPEREGRLYQMVSGQSFPTVTVLLQFLLGGDGS